MSQIEAQRKKIIEESRFDPYKQRYGLFSYPGVLAVGDDSYNPPNKLKKSLGEPVQLARNIYTSSKGDFSPPQFHSTGDKYNDKLALYQKEKERVDKMQKMHSKTWQGGTKKDPALFSKYKHMPDSDVKPQNTRLPRNFLPSNLRKGNAASTPGLTFGKYPVHIPDPYERKEDMLREHRQKQKEKIIDLPFRTTVHAPKFFTPDKTNYDSSFSFDKKTRSSHGMRHPKPFLPTSPPRHTIGQFPKHKPDPDIDKPRLNMTQIEPWKPAHHAKTLHQPAVESNPTNIRKKLRKLS